MPVVDTTGAGDAFRGGFHQRLPAAGADADVADVLTYATAVAGLKCRSLGARDGLPRDSPTSSNSSGADAARLNQTAGAVVKEG